MPCKGPSDKTFCWTLKTSPKSLVNISTGLHAPTEIEVALTNAFDNGIKIVNGELTEGNNADFYDRM
jgi:hypothetical protein